LRLGALGLAAGVVAARSGVPLYDGLGFPDAPYRYAGQSPAPSSATVTLAIQGGRSVGGILATSEKGPQLVLQLKAAAVATSADAVTITASPLPPDGVAPGGTFDGNVYRIAVRDDPGGSTAVRAGSIQLRAAVMTSPAPRLLFRPGPDSGWRALKTNTSGRDILEASLNGVGDYVLERPAGSKAISLGGSNDYVLEFLGFAAVGTFVLASALLRRRRGAIDEEEAGDEDWDPRPR
jgi:hypothetical protein